MSMPNIPNVKPQIDLCFKDTIKLLIASIAEEESAIAKLLNAESKKVCAVVESVKCSKNSKELLQINESVNQTIKNLTKFQMLLQYKLEDSKKMFDKCCEKDCEKCCCKKCDRVRIIYKFVSVDTCCKCYCKPCCCNIKCLNGCGCNFNL